MKIRHFHFRIYEPGCVYLWCEEKNRKDRILPVWEFAIRGGVLKMTAIGYILGIMMGILLGILGAGGSILCIPVLVYLIGIAPVMATTYSLFIVGASALIGAMGYMRRGFFSIKAVVFFGIPSLVSVYISSKYIMPAIPDPLFSIGTIVLSKDLGVMALFAVLMFSSSIAMFRSSKAIRHEKYPRMKRFRYGLIILEGIGLGMITGLLGAGGGFLIIPALVILANLPMKMAIGTSLTIISINSISGFLSKLSVNPSIDWTFLLTFSGLAVLGIFTGMYLSKFISGEKLRFGFGYFILAMGVFILVKEITGIH